MILVTGATGNTGSELVRLLAEVGAPARALVRSPEKAASIKRLGLETALGDFEQPDTLDAAMAGCNHLFLLSPPNPHQAEQERNAIDAAKRAGVGHVVALSVLGSSPDASVAFGRWHGEIDRQALCNKARADIVVAGRLINGGGRTTIIPELFIAERKLGGAQEIGGYHQLASVIRNGDPDSNPVLRRALRDQLLARTRGIAHLLVGLGFYDQRRFPQAADAFRAAQQDWPDPDGRKLLELLLGNTAGKQGRYDRAQQHYQRALAAAPGYGRAQLGLAELTYQRARGACERGKANAAGLRVALRRYQDVLHAVQQPEADLPAKTAFGLGRTYLCLSQAEVADDWAQAETQFRVVISEFNRGNQRLQQLAAEAYAGLGLALLPPRGASDADVKYRQAAGAYQQAIQLSLDPERQGVFFGTLGYIDQRLGDAAHACDSYQRAAALDPHHAGRYQAVRSRLHGCA